MLRAVLALVLIAFVAGVAFYAGRASTAGDHAAAPPVTPLPGVDPGTATTSAPAANVPPSGDTASRARTADVPAPPQLAPEPPSMQSPPVGDLPSSPPAAGAVTAASPSRPFEGNIASPIANLKGTDIRDMFEEARGAGERRHEAIDIMAPRGTPVLAVDSGIIKKLFTSKPGGLTVYQFDSRETVSYYYAHLDRYAAGLKEGVLVKRGDLIGYVGSTGNADPAAPHLHFAIFELGPEKNWWQGTPLNPYDTLLRSLGPVRSRRAEPAKTEGAKAAASKQSRSEAAPAKPNR